MPKLTIDNRHVQVPDGATILDAAEKLSIEIPTMCFLKGFKPATSCMVCIVQVEGKANLVPACGAVAEEGMVVHSDTEVVRKSRKAALELLLSEHVGDCMGPCQVACPAHMDIPLMIRQIAQGQLPEAIVTVKRDIALPAILGRICPAPCEKVCRRGDYDKAVSICLLKRFAADVDLDSPEPYFPDSKVKQNYKVAIVGAGPAGLSAAYYLAREGYCSTIFDEHEKAGGMLRYGVSRQELPEDVIDAEIAQIEKLGVTFKGGVLFAQDISADKLQQDYNAVFIAVGRPDEKRDVTQKLKNITDTANPRTFQTELPGVFAVQIPERQRKLAVRAVADGKEAAVSIVQYLSGQQVTERLRPFNSRIGKLNEEELKYVIKTASDNPRIEPLAKGQGFSAKQAKEESHRCLHCDCLKAAECKLRKYSEIYHAQANQYKAQRRLFVLIREHPDIIFEPGKCIKCGLCIQISAKAGETLGLTFSGRGFDMQVTSPMEKPFVQALKTTALKCAQACPTAALAMKK